MYIFMYIYIYVYMHVYVCMCVYMCILIYTMYTLSELPNDSITKEYKGYSVCKSVKPISR